MVDALNRLDQTDALVEQILGDRVKLEHHVNRGHAHSNSHAQAYPMEADTTTSSEWNHHHYNHKTSSDTESDQLDWDPGRIDDDGHPLVDENGSTYPKSIKVDSTSFTALLTRSKTIGDDKAVHSRHLIIDAACYLHSKDWMHTGWTLQADTANFERDFLLPAPSTNCHGVVHSELRYAIAYAMQNRVLPSVSIDGSRVFSFPVTHYWTPHSCRSYLPSATLLLDFPTLQRDCLGGWSAQASDRYVHTACRSIINMQRAFIRAVHSAKPDSLAEQDLADDFEEFLQSHRLPPDSIAKCLSNLRSPIRSQDLSDTADQPVEDQPAPQPPVVPGPADPSVPFRPAKRQKQAALRAEILGSNPKARRKYGLFTGSATAAHCRTSTTWTTAT